VFCWSDTRIIGWNYIIGHGHLYAFVFQCVVLCRLCVCVHAHACVPNRFLQDQAVTPRRLEAMGSMVLVRYIEEGEHEGVKLVAF